MRRLMTSLSAGLMGLAIVARAHAQAPPPPPPATEEIPAALPTPIYSVNLKTRQACVTPHTKKLARAEGGFIEVATPTPNTLSATMTGTTAANSYLGCTGVATETFQLIQEIEITCSDAGVKTVGLTLDTALVGFVRSKGRAGASVRRAEVSLGPVDGDRSPLALAYPPLSVEGTHGQLCNQHLPPLEGPPMPLGRYMLVATFVLDTSASGVCDSHAVADFSPDTTLPADWVRTRDPFQGVSKKAFGFTMVVTAAAPSAAGAPSVTGGPRNRPVSMKAEFAPPASPADPRARKASF